MRRRVAEDMRMARVTLARTADVSTSEHVICFGRFCFWSGNSSKENSLCRFCTAGLATSGYSAISATPGMMANAYR